MSVIARGLPVLPCRHVSNLYAMTVESFPKSFEAIWPRISPLLRKRKIISTPVKKRARTDSPQKVYIQTFKYIFYFWPWKIVQYLLDTACFSSGIQLKTNRYFICHKTDRSWKVRKGFQELLESSTMARVAMQKVVKKRCGKR